MADPKSCTHYKNKQEEDEIRTYLLNKASQQLSKDEKIILKMAGEGKTLEEMSLKLGLCEVDKGRTVPVLFHVCFSSRYLRPHSNRR